MSRTSVVRNVFVLLVVILLASPSLGSAAPLRGESFAGDLFGAVRQWVLTMWGWPVPAKPARCGIGRDGQPMPCQPVPTKRGCAIDPWGNPVPCQPVPTKRGCGIDPMGQPIPCQ